MDWNNDGHLDILSGCYWSDGAQAGHIEMLAGKGNLEFAEATPVLSSSGAPLVNVSPDVSAAQNDPDGVEWRNICTHQHAVDYDGDGDLDLVTGCIGAEVFFVENTAESGPPELPASPVQLEVTVPGGHSGPHLADWDGDGDLDLLSGSAQGGAFLSVNQGTRQSPQWSSFTELIAPSGKRSQTTDDGGQIEPASSTRVWATDWNNDGLLDLLVGDSVSISNRKPGLTQEEFEKLKSQHDAEMQKMQQEFGEISQRFAAASQEGNVDEQLQQEYQAASQRFSEFYRSMSEFQEQRTTGFVWLYLRKADDSP